MNRAEAIAFALRQASESLRNAHESRLMDRRLYWLRDYANWTEHARALREGT